MRVRRLTPSLTACAGHCAWPGTPCAAVWRLRLHHRHLILRQRRTRSATCTLALPKRCRRRLSARSATSGRFHATGAADSRRGSEFQSDIRKRNEEVVRKSHRNKLAALDKHGKLRRTYELRCKEAEKLEDEASQVRAVFRLPEAPHHRQLRGESKEADKVRGRVLKAGSAAEGADLAYQEAVQQLEESRVLWERDMVRTSQRSVPLTSAAGKVHAAIPGAGRGAHRLHAQAHVAPRQPAVHHVRPQRPGPTSQRAGRMMPRRNASSRGRPLKNAMWRRT